MVVGLPIEMIDRPASSEIDATCVSGCVRPVADDCVFDTKRVSLSPGNHDARADDRGHAPVVGDGYVVNGAQLSDKYEIRGATRRRIGGRPARERVFEEAAR